MYSTIDNIEASLVSKVPPPLFGIVCVSSLEVETEYPSFRHTETPLTLAME